MRNIAKINIKIAMVVLFYSVYLIIDLINKLRIYSQDLHQYLFESVNGEIWLMQFFIAILFLIGGVGMLKKKNWARWIIILLSSSKIVFLYFFGPHTISSLKNHIFNFGAKHPIMVTHDVFSTLLACFMLIYLFLPKLKKLFVNNGG